MKIIDRRSDKISDLKYGEIFMLKEKVCLKIDPCSISDDVVDDLDDDDDGIYYYVYLDTGRVESTNSDVIITKMNAVLNVDIK